MEIVLLVAGLVVGAGAGVGASVARGKQQTNSAEAKAQKIIKDAKKEADKIAEAAKEEERERRRLITSSEKRVAEREVSLDKKLDDLDRRADKLRKSEGELESLKDEIRVIRKKQEDNLQKVAGLSKDEAKDKLMKMTERDIKKDLVAVVDKLQNAAKENAEDDAKMILATAMERMASDQSQEKTVTTVAIDSDEMKGRIIGKEGRNIQAIERLTGVDVLVDDTPGVIVLSCFDPIRRQVARLTIEKLLADGRVHPARIEEDRKSVV